MSKTKYDGDAIEEAGWTEDAQLADADKGIPRVWTKDVKIPGSKSGGILTLREIEIKDSNEDITSVHYEMSMGFDTQGAYIELSASNFPSYWVPHYVKCADAWIEGIFAVSPDLPPNNVASVSD